MNEIYAGETKKENAHSIDYSNFKLFKQDNGEVVIRKKKKNGMSRDEKRIRNKIKKQKKKK